ncbi:hypothetical protein L2E82_04096 [Cichorium intybus]|uniref:Uncharacterized protein n=1 Tax=Cichorium intybus TaxID=13427 RepID=A0ACB9H6I1_CICIN|nr:hypothetical protein L2E82_04096 [Cichorium intybus]
MLGHRIIKWNSKVESSGIQKSKFQVGTTTRSRLIPLIWAFPILRSRLLHYIFHVFADTYIEMTQNTSKTLAAVIISASHPAFLSAIRLCFYFSSTNLHRPMVARPPPFFISNNHQSPAVTTSISHHRRDHHQQHRTISPLHLPLFMLLEEEPPHHRCS